MNPWHILVQIIATYESFNMRQDSLSGDPGPAYEGKDTNQSASYTGKLQDWHASVSDMTRPGVNFFDQDAIKTEKIMNLRKNKPNKLALKKEEESFAYLYVEFRNHVHAVLADVKDERGWAASKDTMDRIMDEKITSKFTKLCQLDDYAINVYLLTEDAEDSFTSDSEDDAEISERFDESKGLEVVIGRVTYTIWRLSLKCEIPVHTPSMLQSLWETRR